MGLLTGAAGPTGAIELAGNAEPIGRGLAEAEGVADPMGCSDEAIGILEPLGESMGSGSKVAPRA